MTDQIIHWLEGIVGVGGGTGILAYAGRAVVMYIVSHNLEHEARKGVHFAEDAYKTFDGEEKLEAAAEWASKRLRKLHIKVSDDDIISAVEAAYNQFKDELDDKDESDGK